MIDKNLHRRLLELIHAGEPELISGGFEWFHQELAKHGHESYRIDVALQFLADTGQIKPDIQPDGSRQKWVGIKITDYGRKRLEDLRLG